MDLLLDTHVAIWWMEGSDRLGSRCKAMLFQPGAISLNHALAIRTLPPHHADPFDRMLIAQAHCENLTLVTADTRIRAYDIRTLDAAS